MTTFTDEQVRQQIDAVLSAAESQGEVRIRAKDGREFTVRPVQSAASAFDIPGVDLKLSKEEIVGFVRGGQEG